MPYTARIGKGGSARCGRSSASIPPPEGSFGNHPRTLTPTMYDELVARKVAVTAEYTAFKSQIDNTLASYLPGGSFAGTALNAALGTGGAGTTFTVVDSTGFPAGAHDVIIDQEFIHITSRSGNTFTIGSRAQFPPSFFWATSNVAHSSGASVWYHPYADTGYWGFDFVASCSAFALANLIGIGDYANIARFTLANAYMYGRSIFSYDYARYQWPYILRSHDWIYDELTDHEKDSYALAAEWQIQNHLDNAYELNTANQTQRNLETQLTNNIPSGSLSLVMLGAAVTHGDNPSAQAQWDAGLAKFTNYVIPSLLSGPFSGGNSQEGAEYTDAIWQQVVDQLEIVRTAIGVDYWPTVSDWTTNFAKFLFHQSTPGSSNSSTTITGTVSSGSTTLTVTSIGDFEVGHNINIAGLFETEIVAISGLTVTLATAPTSTYTSQAIYHKPCMLGYNDVQDNENLNHRHTHWRLQHNTGLWKFYNRLRAVNPTYAGYMKYHLDHFTPLPGGNFDLTYQRFINYDSTVTGVDYRNIMPLAYFVTGAEATGLMISRTAWNAQSPWVVFHGGNRGADHIHSDYNSYKISYKGAFIKPELTGYQGLSGGNSHWVGAESHNTISMKGTGGANGSIGVYNVGTNRPDNGKCTRSYLDTAYAYVQGDASKAYQGTFTGFPSDSQTFIRDFFHLKDANIVVYHDWVAYTAASTSPTQWNEQFPANPTIAGQIITCNYAGQTISQEVILPASATLTEVDQSSEYAFLEGFRIETVSGVSASTEYGLQVVQFGTTGYTPAVNTLLTTSNANVVQIGSAFVVGFVKGATPTLNISYNVTGTPRQLLAGFVPGAEYHVVRATNTITISVATLSGDTTANSGGILDFTL